MYLYRLNLKVRERATCTAAYPIESTVIVECIKDFEMSDNATMDDGDKITNHVLDYIKVISPGLIGCATSHIISNRWMRCE